MPAEPLLFLTDFFPPGYRSGGPARSCFNLSIGLGRILPVKVLTRDTDLGEALPYPNIRPDEWTGFAPGVAVCYCSPEKQGYRSILKKMKKSNASVLYLNSMFSLPFTLYPLLAHWLGQIDGRVVLAPRGMLKPSALQFKALKKKIFLALFKALGWHRFIVFQASSEAESQDIGAVFGAAALVVTCPPVPELSLLSSRTTHHKSASNTRLCIIGRIHPIKNIHAALHALAGTSFPSIRLDIIGPFEDQPYYELCKSIVGDLPAHIEVIFHGALPPEDIQPILQQADFFYLLTQGENFGHAIFEALALGKPVIISDQTPWRGLEAKKAGWDVPLNDPERLTRTLNRAFQMSNEEYQEWSAAAHLCAQTFVDQSDWEKSYLELFGIPPL